MPFCTHLDRTARGLAACGIGPADPTPPEEPPPDQRHDHGTEAIRVAAEPLSFGPASRVLDIGSGIGGPVRYVARTVGFRLAALDLQPELSAIAADLTRRSGRHGRATRLCGDALTHRFPDSAFDAAVSWLAFLHVSDRPRLCARVARALRAKGRLVAEDLRMRAPRRPREARPARHRLRHHSHQHRRPRR